MSSVSYEAWMQAQQSVLGSVLIDDRCASFLVFGLAEEDFCESYRSLYRAIRELYTTGKPVDPVAVLNVVGDSYKDLIVQLMTITPTAANCKMYVDIVKQQSRVLKLRDTGLALSRISTEEEGAELLANAASETVRDDGDVWSLAQGFSDWMHRYQKKPDYLDWFIPQLRRMIRAEKSDYFIVGARPSAGKSAFALQAALYWAVVCNKRVGFFSHETSREKLMDRLVACASGVPMDAIKERTLNDKQMAAVCSISSRINSAPLFLFSAAGRTVQQMQDRALYKRLDIVIVDYLQIVAAPGNDEYTQVTAVSKALHTMCQRFGIFCLALCQLSRTKTDKSGHAQRPRLEDLRSSGQIEQDADGVFFLHPLEEPDKPRELIIAKNKDGALSITKLAFDGVRQQFRFIGKGQQPLKPFDYSSYVMPSQLRLIYANANTREKSSSELAAEAEQVEELLYKLKDQGYDFPGRMRDHVAAAVKASKSKLARLAMIRKNLNVHFMALWESGQLRDSVAYTLAQAPLETQNLIWICQTAGGTKAFRCSDGWVQGVIQEMAHAEEICKNMSCAVTHAHPPDGESGQR